MNSKEVLFLLPECAGYFTELCFEMSRSLKNEGYKILFAVTTPFYQNFKKVNLSEIGKVYYLNEYLKQDLAEEQFSTISINNWSYYSSFARQSYQFGKPLSNSIELKKVKLFFQVIFKENNLSLLISEGVSNSFLYLAYEQSFQSKVPYFGFMAARIPYHFNIHLDVVGNEVLTNRNAPKEHLLKDEVPDYMKNSQYGGLFEQKRFYFRWAFYKQLVHFLLLKSYNSFEIGNSKTYLLKVYKISFRRWFSDFIFRKVLRVYDSELRFESSKIFVVYPLHFYPEASTSVMAKYYDGNEMNVIKNLAFSLPNNARLVVKEHKSNVGNNSLNFYKRVKQLPNTILLDPFYDLRGNIEKFDAVVTLTSTVGFEALTKSVPVYVLGEVFYQNYPGCKKIISYADLENSLRLLGKKSNFEEKSETLNLYSRICFPGSFNYMNRSCLSNDNIALLLKPVFDFLKK
jgi:hypothetical protein